MKCETCDSEYASVLITDLLYGKVTFTMCLPCQHEYVYPLHLVMKIIECENAKYKTLYQKYIIKKFAE